MLELAYFRILLVCISMVFTWATASSQVRIEGQVCDSTTSSALPYATVVQINTLNGTTTDTEGRFSFSIDGNASDTVEVSYVGFESFRAHWETIIESSCITLSPSSSLLDPLIVRPLTPVEYLRKVQRSLSQNQAEFSFNTVSHYEELITENKYIIGHNEGVFRNWHSAYHEGAKSHHQLALHRQENIEKLQFMSKRAEKEKRKYLKNHPENADQFEAEQLFVADLGGPEGIIEMKPNGISFDILDSTLHKEYDIQYQIGSTYMGRELIVIEYVSKGKVDHKKCSGMIYIDKDSDAVVWIKEKGRLIIPTLVKPVLFAMGLSIGSPEYEMELKSRPISGRWYPQFLLRKVSLTLKKKHLVSKNEVGNFQVSQVMEFDEIQIDNVSDIIESKRFDGSKKMSDCIYPIPGLTW